MSISLTAETGLNRNNSLLDGNIGHTLESRSRHQFSSATIDQANGLLTKANLDPSIDTKSASKDLTAAQHDTNLKVKRNDGLDTDRIVPKVMREVNNGLNLDHNLLSIDGPDCTVSAEQGDSLKQAKAIHKILHHLRQ